MTDIAIGMTFSGFLDIPIIGFDEEEAPLLLAERAPVQIKSKTGIGRGWVAAAALVCVGIVATACALTPARPIASAQPIVPAQITTPAQPGAPIVLTPRAEAPVPPSLRTHVEHLASAAKHHVVRTVTPKIIHAAQAAAHRARAVAVHVPPRVQPQAFSVPQYKTVQTCVTLSEPVLKTVLDSVRGDFNHDAALKRFVANGVHALGAMRDKGNVPFLKRIWAVAQNKFAVSILNAYSDKAIVAGHELAAFDKTHGTPWDKTARAAVNASYQTIKNGPDATQPAPQVCFDRFAVASPRAAATSHAPSAG